jgi:hypothetical protein
MYPSPIEISRRCDPLAVLILILAGMISMAVGFLIG